MCCGKPCTIGDVSSSGVWSYASWCGCRKISWQLHAKLELAWSEAQAQHQLRSEQLQQLEAEHPMTELEEAQLSLHQAQRLMGRSRCASWPSRPDR